MAIEKRRQFRPGDRVMVKSPDDILATLDEHGALAGLPFMPEMVNYCGSQFRVARRLEKTCVEGDRTRRFPANDVVFLEELRCDGVGHDGCMRGCMIFWKESWLREARPDESPVRMDERGQERLRERLQVKTDPTHYYCQSTELSAATEHFPWKHKPWMIWVALREIWVGNRSVLEVVRLLAHGVRMVLRRSRIGNEVLLLHGPNKRTPTESLGLQSGDWVRVKTRQEIVETLDENSKNRGLVMAKAMLQNCGRRFQVLDNFDRMISERTGEMREVKNTVSLRGLECHCYYQLGGCPRGDLQYWREIWLENTIDPSTATAGAASRDSD
jgi:hypothetical protein